MVSLGRRCGNTSPNQVTKNSTAERDIIIVTIYELCIKNYLNLSYTEINSPTRSRKLSIVLAIAIVNFINKFNKKRSNYEVPALLTSTVILSSIITFQCNESPCCNSNNFNISCGMTDLTEFGPPLLNFVVYSKIGIPPFLGFLYYIIYLLRYIYLPFIRLIKGYYNNLYILGS